MANLLPVAFHGDTLYLVEHSGEPFAPVKPIAEAVAVDALNRIEIAEREANHA